MRFYALAITALILGLTLWGCGGPTLAIPTASEGEKNADQEKSSVDKAESKTKDKEDPPKSIKDKKSAEPKKILSLKDYLNERHYKWPDEKESDFPLVIEMKAPPVPEEIKGPFPENAPWRTKESPPEKKSGSSFWPW